MKTEAEMKTKWCPKAMMMEEAEITIGFKVLQ
jgi:hypothetical protein